MKKIKLDEGEYAVYMGPFPGTIHGALRTDRDGYPSIYINDWLGPNAKKAAFDHEMRHAENDDMYNLRTIREVENL